MPTYRVTGPDGKVYRVTPPAGTNPTPDEVLARVRSEVERGTPAAAPSGPEDTPSFLRRLGQGYETGAQWLTRQLAQGIEPAPGRRPPPRAPRPVQRDGRRARHPADAARGRDHGGHGGRRTPRERRRQ